MGNACPILTPEQQQASEIESSAKQALMEKVRSAVNEAAMLVREQLAAAGSKLPPLPAEYFESVVHQNIYLKLCKANEENLEGGNISIAIDLIRNQQSIANHYWGAEIELTPKKR